MGRCHGCPLQVLKLPAEGEIDGAMELVEFVPTGGMVPRSFCGAACCALDRRQVLQSAEIGVLACARAVTPEGLLLVGNQGQSLGRAPQLSLVFVQQRSRGQPNEGPNKDWLFPSASYLTTLTPASRRVRHGSGVPLRSKGRQPADLHWPAARTRLSRVRDVHRPAGRTGGAGPLEKACSAPHRGIRSSPPPTSPHGTCPPHG